MPITTETKTMDYSSNARHVKLEETSSYLSSLSKSEVFKPKSYNDIWILEMARYDSYFSMWSLKSRGKLVRKYEWMN